MIALLAGRRIDAINAKTKQFPLEMKDNVYEKIVKVLRERNINVLISSAACGADLLAQKAAWELGIEQHIILPFKRKKFRETSVTDRPGDWGNLFDEIYDKVTSEDNVIVLKCHRNEEFAYSAVTEEIISFPQKLDRKTEAVLAIAAWEKTPRSEEDETYSFLKKAKAQKFEVEEISTLK